MLKTFNKIAKGATVVGVALICAGGVTELSADAYMIGCDTLGHQDWDWYQRLRFDEKCVDVAWGSFAVVMGGAIIGKAGYESSKEIESLQNKRHKNRLATPTPCS